MALAIVEEGGGGGDVKAHLQLRKKCASVLIVILISTKYCEFGSSELRLHCLFFPSKSPSRSVSQCPFARFGGDSAVCEFFRFSESDPTRLPHPHSLKIGFDAPDRDGILRRPSFCGTEQCLRAYNLSYPIDSTRLHDRIRLSGAGHVLCLFAVLGTPTARLHPTSSSGFLEGGEGRAWCKVYVQTEALSPWWFAAINACW